MTARDPMDELARQLFGAARNEAPSEDVRRRVRLTRLEDAQQEGGGIVSMDFADAPSPRARTTGVALSIGGGLALAAVLWLVLHGPLRSPESPFSLSAEPTPAPLGSDHAARPAAQRGEARPSANAVRPQELPRPVRTTAPRSQPHRAPTLAEEIALLDRARAALAERDASRALALVQEYDEQLSGTRLRAEAALVRIEALVMRGEKARAATLAESFVREHPGSPLADRARALQRTASRVTVDGGQ